MAAVQPGGAARAQGTVEQIRSAIAALEAQLAKATERGDAKAVAEAEEAHRRPPVLARRSRADPGRALTG